MIFSKNDNLGFLPTYRCWISLKLYTSSLALILTLEHPPSAILKIGKFLFFKKSKKILAKNGQNRPKSKKCPKTKNTQISIFGGVMLS